MKPHYSCDVIIERKIQIETASPQRLIHKEHSFINGLRSFGCCMLIYYFFF